MSVAWCFDYYSFIILKSVSMMPLALFFLLKIILAIWGALLLFHSNFIIAFSVSVKDIKVFRDCIKSLECLSSMDILTMLIFLIHEHGISLQIFVPLAFFFSAMD
jgi:hypothetical protein